MKFTPPDDSPTIPWEEVQVYPDKMSLVPPSTTARISGCSNWPRLWNLTLSRTASASGAVGIAMTVVAAAGTTQSWPEC